MPAAAQLDILMKVETHNHPTAISPFPGAATGSGGEIRDEGATGIGSKPKTGLCGFSVSNLRIPVTSSPGKPTRASRPHRVGARYHARGPHRRGVVQQRIRSSQHLRLFPHLRAAVGLPDGSELRGYHKPIMVAGGVGAIRREHVDKRAIPAGPTSSCSAARRC